MSEIRLTRGQVHRITGCPINKIDKWIKTGEFKPEHINEPEQKRYSTRDVFILGLVYMLRQYSTVPVPRCFEVAGQLHDDDTNDAYFVRIGNSWRLFKERPLNGVYLYVNVYQYATVISERIGKYHDSK